MPGENPGEAAWFAVHDALLAYPLVGPVTFDPGNHATGRRFRCRVHLHPRGSCAPLVRHRAIVRL
jgi:hypothetical protein